MNQGRVKMNGRLKSKNWFFSLKMCTVIDVCFIFTHAFIAMLMFALKTPIPAWYNVASSAFYVCLLGLLYQKKSQVFFELTVLEVFIYSMVGCYFYGWGCDFQVTIVALCICAFYINYQMSDIDGKSLSFALRSTLMIIGYMGMMVYLSAKGPFYQISQGYQTFFRVIHDGLSWMTGIVCLGVLGRAISRTEMTIRDIAGHDYLTGLYTRQKMDDVLDAVYQEVISTGNRYLLGIIDIDDFKLINDKYGHLVGDEVLKKVATYLVNLQVPGRTICRWGGEEFMLLLPYRDLDTTLKLLRDLIQQMADEKFIVRDIEIHVTVTLGLANLDRDHGIAVAVNQADNNLYIGKRDGKNQVVYHV